MNGWVPLALSRFRRPQQTLLPGLGVAAAVVAAVIATSALASGIIVYSLSSEDPPARPSAALVLDPVRPDVSAAKPLVRRGAREPVTSRRSRATPAAAPAVAGSGRRDSAVEGSLSPQGITPGSDPGPRRGGDGSAAPEQTVPSAPDDKLAPDGAPDATIPVVHAATDPLARGLRATVGALGAHTEAIARTVVAALDDTGDGLRNVAGGAVARLLGGSPAR
jgi:hypothetical protein